MKDVYTIDFETAYGNKIGLGFGCQITQEYIQDPRFEIIGVGIAKNDEPAVWYSYPDNDYESVLAPLHNQIVIAHNAKFDCGILSLMFDILPAVNICTLSMAKPLHGLTVGGSLKALAEKYGIGEKGTEVVKAENKFRKDFTKEQLAAYGEYCKTDVELCRQLYPLLKKYTHNDEMRVIDGTIRMFTEPKIVLDTEMLSAELESEKAKKRKLLIEARVPRETLMSNPKFAEELKLRGVEPPMKANPKGQPTFAFAKSDEGFTNLLQHEDEDVRTLVEARLAMKSTLNETRMQRMINISKLGPLCVPLGYCGALTTWRWSGEDKLNLQNLPSRGDNTIRRAMRAPSGYKLVVADSSNIELRVNHAMAGQMDTVDKLKDCIDLYKDFAADLFSVPYTEVTKDQRFVGKVAHLSLGYQSGWVTFQNMVRLMGGNISDDDSQQTVEAWRRKHPYVVANWSNAQDLIKAMLTGDHCELPFMPEVYARKGVLITPPHHHIQYPSLKKIGREYQYKSRRGRGTEIVKLYGGKVVENLCQHVSRNILAEQFNKIRAFFPVALMVHDEFICVVPDDEAEDCLDLMTTIMSTSPEWWPEIPLAAEGDIAETYGDAK